MSPARKAGNQGLVEFALLSQISEHYTRTMEQMTRNVDDLSALDRQALDRVLGRPLREDQQGSAASFLPEWCQVYEGLSDTAIAELEQIIRQRADFSRPGE